MSKKEVLGFLIGSSLGDGCVYSNGSTIIQHAMIQKDWLLCKVRRLQEFGLRCTVTENTTCRFPWIRAYVQANDRSRRIERKLYRQDEEGRKRVLNYSLLSPLSLEGLAVWYLDCGSLTLHKFKDSGKIKSREIYWGTEAFDLESHNILRAWMFQRLGIEAKVGCYTQGRSGRSYHRLVLNATAANGLFPLIAKYVPDSMKYKIDMQYCS